MQKTLKDIWDTLPELEHTYKYIDEKTGLKIYEVCGKKFQETAKLEYIIPILQKFYEGYGARAKLAAENKGIDWKAISHALRAAYQTKQLLLEHTITFPLKEAPYLLKVKKGELDFLTEVSPCLEDLMDEVEELAKISALPEKVDREYWDLFMVDVIKENLINVSIH